MVEAISSYQGSNDELYELRKALLSDISNKKLSNKKEETPKELSQKAIEKEIRLSSNDEVQDEEISAENEEVVQEAGSGITVNASEIDILSSSLIDIQANIETEDAEYDEEMDLDKDGTVTDEERIRYYSEKYESYGEGISLEPQTPSFDAEVPTIEKKTENVTNPINNNMSLINKMQANYGKITPEVNSGLSFLI